MAFDALPFGSSASFDTAAAPQGKPSFVSNFRKSERLVVLAGASATGALGGFFIAMALGRIELWQVLLLSAPVFALSFHFTRETLADALYRKAYGCATAAGLHAMALLAWPITALFAPMQAMVFWATPVAAISALVLVSMCWTGSSRAIYRTCAQGAMVTLIAAHQGALLMLG
jgi:hypothetical protein